jgi:hypothetical protein
MPAPLTEDVEPARFRSPDREEIPSHGLGLRIAGGWAALIGTFQRLQPQHKKLGLHQGLPRWELQS